MGDRMIRWLLHGFGYLAAHVLFLGTRSPEAVVRRLRWAYRVVGVDITAERTIFLCPYRSLGAARFGRKWVCHDILDRVDDGYVSYLRRHRAIDYQRPRDCAELPYCADDAEHCFSEVSRRS